MRPFDFGDFNPDGLGRADLLSMLVDAALMGAPEDIGAMFAAEEDADGRGRYAGLSTPPVHAAMFAADDGEGHWVTIDGTHVFIKGGKIEKGPAGMVGKSPEQLGKPVEKDHGPLHPETHTREGPARGAADAAEAYRKLGTKAPAFKAWFGDWEKDPKNASKVVDEKGEPKEQYEIQRVYHGRRGDFEAFDKAKIGSNGLAAGVGFYFAENKKLADTFAQGGGNVLECFLNVRNPFAFDGAFSPKELTGKMLSLAREVSPDSFDPSSAFGKFAEEDFKRRVQEKTQNGVVSGYDAWDILRQTVDAKNVNEVLAKAGYDGIMHDARDEAGTPAANPQQAKYGRVWIAFEPNQIKAVDNAGTFDPKNPNIGFSADADDGRGRLSADFYSPDQPRDDHGRWTAGAGTGMARDYYRQQVRDYAKKTGFPTREEAAALADHLSRMTVGQLHDLRREHGLKASGIDKAGLVRRLAERFAEHRAKAGGGAAKSFGEYKVEPYGSHQFASVHTDPKTGRQTSSLHGTREEAEARAASGHATDEAYRSAGRDTSLVTSGGNATGTVAEVEEGARKRLGARFGGMSKVRYGPGSWQYEVYRIKDGMNGREKVLDRTYQIQAAKEAGPAKSSTPPVTAPHPSGATVEPATAYDRRGWYAVRSPGGMVVKQFPTEREAKAFRDSLPARPALTAEDERGRLVTAADAAKNRLTAAEARAKDYPHRQDVLDELEAARMAAGSPGAYSPPVPPASVPVTAAARNTAAKAAHEMTQSEWDRLSHAEQSAHPRIEGGPSPSNTNYHPLAIASAIAEGKSVPQSVRDSYPHDAWQRAFESAEKTNRLLSSSPALSTPPARPLPPLSGSPAQIPIAGAIRTRILADAERHVRQREAANHPEAADDRKALAQLRQEHRAGWWMDNRRRGVGDLLDEVYRRKVAAFAEDDGRGRYAGSAAPFADDGDGVWRTIEGAHVFIKDGVIAKGPSHLAGKKLSDLPSRRPETVGKNEHEHAAAVEREIAHSLRGQWEPDNKAYDVMAGGGKHPVEVKSLLKGSKQSLSVHPDALARKVAHAEANPGSKYHTVAVDEREHYQGGAHKGDYSGYRLYYKRGAGRYSLSKMHPVGSAAELRRLVHAKDEDLPEKARGALPSGDEAKKLRESAEKAHASRLAKDRARKARLKSEGKSAYERQT